MFELIEPIATVTFSEVANEAFLALGMRDYRRAGSLGGVPAVDGERDAGDVAGAGVAQPQHGLPSRRPVWKGAF
ncbi:hypothetical protein ACIHFD_34930 [Nonomuraea sp. NPDC051941]|uniref:hypothetical protein n=1 Tax=Nonomuraea sp. NPDC051941 TaxID=3364373 RepID=UPI0037CAE887